MKRTLFTQGVKTILALTVAVQLANWAAAADYGKNKDQDKTQAGSATLSKKDIQFMTEVADGGLAEVRMGELAEQKGQSADVKQFGQRLVVDHGKANDELKQLASKKGVTLPTQVSNKHQKMIDKLASTSEFDKQFKSMAIKDHKKDIKQFEKAEKKCEDPDLRAWVTKTLPTLQEHLRTAEQLGATRTARTQ
jgi:putative membrane protein